MMTLNNWSFLISLVALGITAVIVAYSWQRYRPLALVMPLWLAAAWLLSQRGFFADASGWSDGDLVGFNLFGVLMTLPIILFFVAQARSPRLRQFLADVPLSGLIGLQVYRVAGSIFFWLLAAGLVPTALGLSAGIADVTVGLLALPLAWLVAQGWRGSRPLAVAWNLFGILDFVTAVTLVSLSILGVVALQPEPVRIGLHPLALISLFQLPLSIILHVLSLRRLGRRNAQTPELKGTYA